MDNANVGTPDILHQEKQSKFGVTKSVAPFLLQILEVILVVKINGEALDVIGKTVADYLIYAGYDIKRVAVEKNGDIVPKAEYDTTHLCDGDSVEVVSFVGGG